MDQFRVGAICPSQTRGPVNNEIGQREPFTRGGLDERIGVTRGPLWIGLPRGFNCLPVKPYDVVPNTAATQHLCAFIEQFMAARCVVAGPSQ